MGKMLQKALKRPFSRVCTCIRCRAKEFVSTTYPNLDDEQVLAIATQITKVLQRAAVSSQKEPS
jgi:hypothetical protein